ncbi:SdiA-regulated domain-containing protein [Mucilaginibacter flavus]|uniref:SdiA-regulated domain-containing protein n=1 Tax=Mucilaginibacter flavus TaxID=931504 RepID=UPI0025B5C63D|nr:SdiA-regulated domain-containing protein [Mucilaginibacter flavus]MDN3583263.1 SdiA-regulated domain-containing protein [Mucilaginibacter flavus]
MIIKRSKNIAINLLLILFVMAGLMINISCTQKSGQSASKDEPTNESEAAESANPKGYDLSKPEKFNMPDDLLEISGITFLNGNADMLYAEEDEDGRVYYLKLGDKQASYVHFGKKGDYEDLGICNGNMVLLRSDGVFFTFPFGQVKSAEVDARKQDSLLPEGEYEGMYADDKSKSLYVLCKHCADDKTTKASSGYILSIQTDGTIKQTGTFSVDVTAIEKLAGQKKIAFHPSALTKNQATNEWYILSSVNKMLVVADASWKIKAVYPLNSAFNQPEGIAFDAEQNLYISNEGGKLGMGNVLKFRYNP